MKLKSLSVPGLKKKMYVVTQSDQIEMQLHGFAQEKKNTMCSFQVNKSLFIEQKLSQNAEAENKVSSSLPFPWKFRSEVAARYC